MKPMAVCFLSSAHSPTDKRVFDKEAVSLAAAGFRVTHICPDEAESTTMLRGVRIRTFTGGAGLLGRASILPKLYRLARAEAADVYHANEVDSWAVAVLLRILRKKKCVFDVHEHYPSTFAQSRFPPWMRRAVEGSVRFAFRVMTPFTDRIVLAKSTVGPDFHCPAEKKVLVRNFSRVPTEANLVHRAPREPGSPLRLVHLGVFNKLRGWPQILAAMAEARSDLRLEVIGTINDGSEAEFRRRVAELDLTDRVTLTEWLPFEEAFQLLLRADVGLIAFQPGIQNHVFAMPHKLFDYMAAGMAVLLPKEAIEVAPVIEETRCGFLIDPADPSEIAARLDWLAENRQAAFEMGQRGQVAVKEKYNWDSEAVKFVSMYRELEHST